MTENVSHDVSHDAIRWPRKWRGWKTLFWLWLGRCPVHHSSLNVDNALYDDGVSAYCFRCEGVAIWPQGAREALRQNYRAEAARRRPVFECEHCGKDVANDSTAHARDCPRGSTS